MSATEEISTASAGRRIAALAGHLTLGDVGEHATGLSKQVSCSQPRSVCPGGFTYANFITHKPKTDRSTVSNQLVQH